MRQELDYLRSNKQRIEKEIENIKNSLEENKKKSNALPKKIFPMRKNKRH